MKRYFDLPSSRLVCELTLEGPKAAEVPLEFFKKQLRCEDLREISRKEFNRLSKEYTSGGSNEQM